MPEKNSFKQLLVEIGTEEIPAGFLTGKDKELKKSFRTLLDEARLAFRDVAVYITPRRLTVYTDGIAPRQAELSETVKGPPMRICKNDDGSFAAPALGFARKFSIPVEKLSTIEQDGVPYLSAVKTSPVKPTAECVPRIIEDFIKHIHWQKSMRWADHTPRFVRPIRWILCMMDNIPVTGTVFNIPLTSQTFGLRTEDEPVSIESASSYVEEMKKHGIIINHDKRRRYIEESIQDAITSNGGEPDTYSKRLLDEVTYLVESPKIITGEFPETFLYLPEPVLLSAIEVQQRYFPVFRKDGKLLNKFIIVANGSQIDEEIVKQGNQRVLVARLKDAEFFFREDRKSTLYEKKDSLASVTFLKNLGTLEDRFRRTGYLINHLASEIYPGKFSPETLTRTAELAKADLVTEMVKEFPHLQGTMGKIYAHLDNEPEEISEAISEQYKPHGPDDDLPFTPLGTLLSLADKFDLFLSSLASGAKASGSADPLGIRRACIGIIRIVLSNSFTFSLSTLIKKHLENLGNFLDKNKTEDEIQDIFVFLRNRLTAYLKDSGHRTDIVEAVLLDDFDDLSDVESRTSSLTDFSRRDDFIAVTTSFKRVMNILEQAKKVSGEKNIGDVRVELFETGYEKDMHESSVLLKEKMDGLIPDKKYKDVLSAMADIRPAVDGFFDNVMVMSENEILRKNRLSLLTQLGQSFLRLVDFRRIILPNTKIS